MLNKLLILLLFITISIFASDLDSKIEALHKAPKNQRYKIMNEIKMELIKLNQSQRDHFLQKLLKHKKGNHLLHNHKNNIKKNYECQSINSYKHKNSHSSKNKNKQNHTPQKNNNDRNKHDNGKNGNRHK